VTLLLRAPLVGGLLQRAAATFDVAVVRLAQELSRRAAGPGPTHAERRVRLDQAAAAYATISAERFFAAPPPLTNVSERHVRPLRGGEVADLQWESGWQPLEPAGRDHYLSFAENRTAHARLLRHAEPRPALICLHGYRAGIHRFEELAWRSRHLYRLGLDVAHLTLPFHALRAPAGRSGMFPGTRTGRTVEGFGQALWDLRSLLGWMRARGAPLAGVAGMSLGGYTAALAATVEARLDYAVLYIPLADLAGVAVEHEALRGRTIPASLADAGRRALALVSPLERAPLLPGEKMLVVAAEVDRITAARTHATRLSAHFRAPMVTFPGSHLVQLGRDVGFAAMERLFSRCGALAPRNRLELL
jgi:hypothetical protein